VDPPGQKGKLSNHKGPRAWDVARWWDHGYGRQDTSALDGTSIAGAGSSWDGDQSRLSGGELGAQRLHSAGVPTLMEATHA
jgi:hypothetical protein